MNESPVAELARGISAVHACSDELALHTLLRRVLAGLNIQSYIFVLHSRTPTGQRASSHWLHIGCMPEFSQLYVTRRWYVNDPAIHHARTSSRILALDALPSTSQGQRELREKSRVMGFGSGIAIPAHGGKAEQFGVLLLGTLEVAEEPNPVFSENRILLRSLAMELFEWLLRKSKEEARQRLALSDMEISILVLQNREYRGVDIACELGLSPKTVHNAVRKIKEKFGAVNIRAALIAAESLGLI